ncbi:MFS transporter [Sphingobium chungbukense]|nr:MFS transporter [Sphingobium chungbukense]
MTRSMAAMRASAPAAPGRSLPFIVASVMMLVTLAIDVVLPALPDIGEALAVTRDNDRQYVISSFMFGFAISQAGVGIVSDALGRRGLLLGAVGGYAAFSLAAAAAQDLTVMLIVRFLQGAAGGMTRVLINAAVRDLYSGAQMARVMSMATTAFIIAPILGPALGTLILAVASWRWIFIAFAGFGILSFLIICFRLPETLPPAMRRKLSAKSLVEGVKHVLQDRQSTWFTTAMSFRFAGQFAFFLSLQQIFEQVWKHEDLLAPVFGFVAAVIAIGSMVNARLVTRVGLMRMSRITTLLLTTICAAQLAWVALGSFGLIGFIAFQAAISALTSICNTCFQALAMENMGRQAATASSIQGSGSMLAGTLLASWAGQAFDGTLLPYAIAITLFAIGGLFCTFMATQRESGRASR